MDFLKRAKKEMRSLGVDIMLDLQANQAKNNRAAVIAMAAGTMASAVVPAFANTDIAGLGSSIQKIVGQLYTASSGVVTVLAALMLVFAFIMRMTGSQQTSAKATSWIVRIIVCYNLSDSYENGNFSESSYSNLNFNTTYAETIDDMVTFAGRLILEAGGADPETISFTFGSSANYLSPIISLSGNGSQDMVNTARSFLENVGGAQFKKWYPLSPTSAWCACFVSYVADQCGYIDAGIIPKFCGCDAGKNWFVANGLYKSADSGYIPRPGDIVFYASPSNMGHMKHVGIVVSAESADVVHTIEGNTSKPGNPSAPYGVYEKTRHRNNGSLRIAGYGTPNYPTSSVSGFQSPVGPNWREMVTSEFGNRIDPITHVRKGHNGMDLACPTGTQIHAALDGTVIIAKNQGSYGNYVKIDHGDGLQTLYAHNSRLLVKEGQTVRAGDVIALSGSTGRSTGPHCHFEVWLNGSRTQPRDYLP